MRIEIKNQNKVRFWLWLPSWIWIINEVLKHIKFDNKKIGIIQRKRIISAIKIAKNKSRFIADIDIQSHDGNKIRVKV